LKAGIRFAVLLLAVPQLLSAQGVLSRFSYEGLRFTGIGFDIGMVASDRVTTEVTGSVRIDYGYIAPNVRVLIGGSYFKGDFDEKEVADFETRLRGVVDDPTGDFTIEVGTITWSDFEANLDFQYLPATSRRVQPYVGLGFAAHIRNGSGPAIAGTFVEDALDTIDAGVTLSAGALVAVVSRLYGTVDLRAGLASELRTGAVRVGIMYRVPQ
jgi:hypothetical protein